MTGKRTALILLTILIGVFSPVQSQTRPEPLEMARRISVDFHDADIKTVLLAFSEFSGISIIASKNVSGRITARISHMPWDQALYSLLETNGLAVRETNGILTVDTIENIRENEKLEDLESHIFRLNFQKSVEIAPTLSALLSERGKLQADEGANAIMVIDIPDRIEKVREVLVELDQQTRQVEITVQLSFVNKRELHELGVNWRAANTGNPLTDTRFDASTGGADNVLSPYGQFAVGTVRRGVNISATIAALEDMNKAHTIARPVITTLNNLPARVLVGQRTPLRVVDYGATGAAGTEARATTQMVETGVKLNVIPQITDNDKILVQILAENSDAEQGADGVFFNTQEASTRLLLNNGETGIIAGLTVNNTTKVRNGLPFLSSVPLIGRLFSYQRDVEEEEELIILVTGRIIKPVEEVETGEMDTPPVKEGGK